ncbi:precorrin-6B methylase [Butyricicoccus sp.]|uniref:precorrin-6B methylase n=1 Tax=Butyricicoccus sp. TaxID=2049021 RepID=UPI002A8EA61D|nr:precorrin-6B methylase [Butyricicoccus sp.]
MENNLFTNAHILAWLQYFSDHSEVDLERVKILDITRKNKNLIPTVESHRSVLVFTEAGHPDIFYRMYNAGLGECTVIYNEGSEPEGPIKESKVYDMLDRGINASAGMLILNPKARSTFKFGMSNQSFAYGSVRYVGSEIRAVILSKMQIDMQKNICVISGESIAVEAANLAAEGTVIAVEYNHRDRKTLEDNVSQFGLNNVTIVDHVDEETMAGLPVPDVTMLVASASMEQEMECLLKLNPNMEFVVYTLDFHVAAGMPALCSSLGIHDVDIIQLSVSKLNSKHNFDTQPAPWIITGKAGE